MGPYRSSHSRLAKPAPPAREWRDRSGWSLSYLCPF